MLAALSVLAVLAVLAPDLHVAQPSRVGLLAWPLVSGQVQRRARFILSYGPAAPPLVNCLFWPEVTTQPNQAWWRAVPQALTYLRSLGWPDAPSFWSGAAHISSTSLPPSFACPNRIFVPSLCNIRSDDQQAHGQAKGDAVRVSSTDSTRQARVAIQLCVESDRDGARAANAASRAIQGIAATDVRTENGDGSC